MKWTKRNIIIALVIVAIIILIYINRVNVKKAITSGIQSVLSIQQESYLSDLHPAVRDKFRQFINEVQQKTGYTIIVTSGYRSFQKQAQLYAENNKNAPPGGSPHNYGLALDINAQKGTTWLRKASTENAWLSSGIIDIADRMGLRWGGRFNGYPDRVHFDMMKFYNITQLKNLALQQFGSLENAQGNQINLA